ncbi:MAG: archaellin/type IV pilin N-terminal domain-containing protein [Candidatus Bathyarchaeia archaeon]
MKILKSRKALSPVVASIILIAVTVAVSIAVAAWMGALTVGFMGSSSLTITNVTFNDDGTVTLAVKNTGTNKVTVSQVKVNNAVKNIDQENSKLTYEAGETGNIIVELAYTEGNLYKFDLFDSSGQVVGSTQATAPS